MTESLKVALFSRLDSVFHVLKLLRAVQMVIVIVQGIRGGKCFLYSVVYWQNFSVYIYQLFIQDFFLRFVVVLSHWLKASFQLL